MPQLPLDDEPDTPIRSTRLGFFSWVAITMAALHLKERWDQYRRVPFMAHSTTEDDDETASQIPLDSTVRRRTRPRRPACCVLCGIDCTLLWKAVGIVVSVWLIWNTFKFIRWAVTPAKSGLEEMPEYSTSIGCSDAQYLYSGGKKTFMLGMDRVKPAHTLDLVGMGAGTILLTQGLPEWQLLSIEATIRTDRKDLVDQINFSSNNVSTSKLETPANLGGGCVRFDLVISVPKTLKHLTLNLESTTQVKFDPMSANFPVLEELVINSHSNDHRNMILADYGVKANKILISSMTGWIVGDLSVGNSLAQVDTRAGTTTTNLKVMPAPALVVTQGGPAHLVTYSGSGRTDIFYRNDPPPSPWHQRRSINSTHFATQGSDLYLTYSDATFNGLVDIKSSSYSARNLIL